MHPSPLEIIIKEKMRGTEKVESDVRPFNLDPSKHSAFVITNYLWDLMP